MKIFFKNAVRQNLFHLFIIIMIFLLGNKNQLLAESPIVLKLTTGNSHNFPLLIGNGTKFNWEKPGVTIELLQLVDEEIPQIKLNYYRTNWRRCLDQLKK
ncbi:MAG: hypothetical protein GY714_30605 [Desulfobacterales bacterium]|nr:hypothetical protein [Desulfobacterales bacterium]